MKLKDLDPAAPMPMPRKLGYGVGMYGIFIVWLMTAYTLMNFYTEILGLTAGQAGTIFLVASVLEAITDPIMGWINDRVRTRWGRYRPWLLFGSVPFALSFFLVYTKPDISDPTWVYGIALAAHLVFRTFYTIIYMPYTSMIAQLSSNARERASLAGVKHVFTSLAGITISFLALDAIEWFGQGNDIVGFQTAAGIIAIVAVAALILCFLSTREPLTQAGVKDQVPDLGTSVRALGANKAFWLIFFGVIAFSGSYTMINKALVYEAQWNLGDRTLAKYGLTAMAVAGLVSPLLWVPISRATSKRLVWVAGCALAALGLVAVYLVPAGNLMFRTGLFFIAGCGIAAVLMTFYAAVADASDYGEWRTGVRLEALLFGFVAFANKVSLGIGAWILGLGLESAGYQSGGEVVGQTPTAMSAITTLMTLVPAAGFILSAAIVAFFPVSNKLHGTIERELATRRAAAA